MPKTWTKDEIKELILKTLMDTSCDSRERFRRAASYEEYADNILADLDRECLIEYTP